MVQGNHPAASRSHLMEQGNHPVRLRLPPLHRGELFEFFALIKKV